MYVSTPFTITHEKQVTPLNKLCGRSFWTELLATYKESKGENAEDVSEEIPLVQEVTRLQHNPAQCNRPAREKLQDDQYRGTSSLPQGATDHN